MEPRALPGARVECAVDTRERLVHMIRLYVDAQQVMHGIRRDALSPDGRGGWRCVQCPADWCSVPRSGRYATKYLRVHFVYSYKYHNVKERLVIMPLMNICNITISQALGLYLGAAPAWPAKTSKRETTKGPRHHALQVRGGLQLGRPVGPQGHGLTCAYADVPARAVHEQPRAAQPWQPRLPSAPLPSSRVSHLPR